MAVKIELKRSSVPGKVPTTNDLELGEIAINTYDGKIYFKKDDGTQAIVQTAGGGSGSVASASYATFAATAGSATSASYSSTAGSATSASYATFAATAGSATSASYAATASFTTNATSASYAATSSYADNFTVAGTLTAQTIVAQTITSSTEYITGSTIFGSLLSNTHQFTGSVSITGSLTAANANISGSFSGSLSNLQGSATYIPFFSSSQVLANSSIYQVNTASIAINQTSITTANPEALYVSQTHPTSINVISGKGNLDNYLQLNIFNTNQGVSASSDIVATANNGNETSNYIDMGINSELYSQNFIGAANDAYIYSTGNDLHIGNATPNKPLQLFVGGTDVDIYNKLQLNPNNQHQMSGSLDVSGSVKAFSFTGSLLGTASYTTTASYAANADLLDGKDSTTFATTGSNTFIGNQTITGSLFTTGSNTFVGNQTITGSLTVSGSTVQIGNNTLTGNTSLTGSITVSGSQTFVGTNIITGSVNISGSTTQIGNNTLLGNTTLTGSITVQGALKLDSSIDPGNTALTSSFLFTSASNTETGYDLYYRQAGNLIKFKWIEGGLSTGLLYGGNITYSGSTIFIKKGSGVINNMNAITGSEISPILTYVTWNDYTSSATYLTSSQNTYLYVDASGSIFQQTSFFNQTQYEQAIPLGRVTHPNYISITGVGSNVQTTYDSDTQQNDFIRAFGPLKVSGFSILPQTGSLRLGIGSGIAYNLGGFYTQDPNSPSHYESAGFATASIARAWRSGSGVYLDNNGGAFYNTVDPDYWDDGTGTLNTMAAGDWQIQRVFANPVTGRVVVYYGQTGTYSNLLNALQYLATDPFEEGEFTAKSLVFVGYLVLKGQTNNLTDTTNNRIINAGIFRNIAGGSSGGSAVSQTLNAVSSSFASTASFVQNAQTASYVLNAVSSSNAATASNISPAITNNTNNYILTATGNGQINGESNLYFDGTNLGIGTTSPATNLNVYNAGAAAGFLLQTNSSTDYAEISVRNASAVATSYFRQYSLSASGTVLGNSVANLATFFSNFASNFAIGTLNGGSLILGTNNTERMRIDTSGNVVIGKTTANAILDVNGSAIISGSLTVTGGITGSISSAATASYANSGFNIGISQISTATVASSIAGANNLFTTSTGSFSGAKYIYTATSASNARMGEVLAVWNRGSVQYTDISTLDIGTTTAVTASVAIVTAQAQLNFQTNTSGWTIKSQATFL